MKALAETVIVSTAVETRPHHPDPGVQAAQVGPGVRRSERRVRRMNGRRVLGGRLAMCRRPLEPADEHQA
jgi:hypothetical protein